MILPNSKPKLVVLTGLPASGKSEAAQFLSREYGYEVLSTDESRQRLFGKDYGDMRKTEEEGIVRETIDYAKRYHLARGLNVVIDSCAPTNKFRSRMLSLPEYLDDSVDRYLVHIDTPKEIIRCRQLERGRSTEAIETIASFWQDSNNEFKRSRLLKINNNRNLEELYKKLIF